VTEAAMRRRVAEARVGRLATVTPEGRPHLVPICFALAGDLLFSAVDAKPKRTQRLRRLENIAAHPDVAVLVDHYDEDWTRLWWVRVDGRARIVADEAERETALGRLAEKYEPYRASPPRGAVIAIEATSWRGWAA
jgi:PPOX class probable F420-dependent enzyme